MASAPGRRLGIAKATVDAVALVHLLAFLGIAPHLDDVASPVGQVAFTYLFFAAGLLQMASIILWGAYWAALSAYLAPLRMFPNGTAPVVASAASPNPR
jgi:hypothetical protein